MEKILLDYLPKFLKNLGLGWPILILAGVIFFFLIKIIDSKKKKNSFGKETVIVTGVRKDEGKRIDDPTKSRSREIKDIREKLRKRLEQHGD